MAVPAELLAALSGTWRGTYRLWLEPGSEPRQCATRASVRAILDDRFLVYEYDWSFDGDPQHGVATLGRDGEGRFQLAWLDTWHNGDSIMFCIGPGPEPIVTGTYAPDDPAGPWHWRTEFSCTAPDAFSVVAYNVTPAGEESKATAAVYTRVDDSHLL